jgi:hypothetical protein
MNELDNRFEFLVEYITTRVVEYIMKDKDLGLEDALFLFHNSETFEKLCDKETGMYIESPKFIYEILQDEFRYGSLRHVTE